MGAGDKIVEGIKQIADWAWPTSYPNVRLDIGGLYCDLHNHLYPSYNYGGIDNVIEAAMKRVDIMAITSYFGNVSTNSQITRLNFETFCRETEKSDVYHAEHLCRRDGVPIAIRISPYLSGDKGNYRELYVIRSQEVMSREGYHFLSLGANYYLDHGMPAEDTVKLIQGYEGIAGIAHPCSAYSKLIKGRIRSDDELSLIHKGLKKVDFVETFNSQNELWLCMSNVKAKELAETYEKPGIAASDNHCDLRRIGYSGIIIKYGGIRTADGDIFIKSLKRNIVKQNFDCHKKYNDPVSFVKSFILRR